MKRILVFAAAVFPIIGNRLIIIALDAFNTVLNEKIDHLIDERRISSEVSEMVALFYLCSNSHPIGCLKGFQISMYVTEYRNFHSFLQSKIPPARSGEIHLRGYKYHNTFSGIETGIRVPKLRCRV